jgi:hypothetical protein
MLSKYRRRVALLSAVTLAGTMLALVPTSTVGSQTVYTPLANHAYSACPASAGIPSAGFTDTTSTDVDCIKMFGITTGTTDTTYSPDDPVTRWQMALYLTRAAGPAGVTLGAGADQSMTDIAGESAEIQTAINQIIELGISVGKTATTFAPADNVTREEMALFIKRFLAVSTRGPGGSNDLLADDDNLLVSGVASPSTVTNYTDIDSGTTYEGRQAIVSLWHMGVTDDPSSTATSYSTTFSPNSSMTRAAMATFMTEALGHTNARPAGLTLQYAAWDEDTGETQTVLTGAQAPTMSASNRAADFTWASGTIIDVFHWVNSTVEGNTDFTALGVCDDTVAATNSVTACKVETGDQTTDSLGNTTPVVASQAAGKTADYYAWTAATGTTYDNDLHAADSAKQTIYVGYAATDILVSHDASPTAQLITATEVDSGHSGVENSITVVPFGKDITISAQPVLGYDTGAAAIPHAALNVTFGHMRIMSADSLGLIGAGSMLESVTSVVATPASGAATYLITAPADRSTTVGDIQYDIVTVTNSLGVRDGVIVNLTPDGIGLVGNDWDDCGGAHVAYTVGKGGNATNTQCYTVFKYMDTADAFNTVSLAQSADYGQLSTAGLSRTLTATTTDQYGDALVNQTVTFSSLGTLPAQPTIPNGSDTFTTDVAHGLVVGAKLVLDATDSCALTAGPSGGVSATALAAEAVMSVSIVTTTSTFQLTSDGHSDAVVHAFGAGCADGTNGAILKNRSMGPAVSRTTGTAGTATYTWSDTTGTTGLDVVSATSGTVTASKTFYRTLNTSGTALTTALEDGAGTMTVSEWNESTSAAATGSALRDAASEVAAYVVVNDAANDKIVVAIESGDIGVASTPVAGFLAGTGTPTTYYMQYAYDDNDQYCYNYSATDIVGGTCQTGTTMATFESQLAKAPAIINGTAAWSGTDDYNTTYSWAGGGGPSLVDYEVLSTGISRFYIG